MRTNKNEPVDLLLMEIRGLRKDIHRLSTNVGVISKNVGVISKNLEKLLPKEKKWNDDSGTWWGLGL